MTDSNESAASASVRPRTAPVRVVAALSIVLLAAAALTPVLMRAFGAPTADSVDAAFDPLPTDEQVTSAESAPELDPAAVEQSVDVSVDSVYPI